MKTALSCSCCTTNLHWSVSRVRHGIDRASSVRCGLVEAIYCICCLHVFFVHFWQCYQYRAGDLYLTPCAKIFFFFLFLFACRLFPASSFGSSNFFFPPFCPCFCLSWLCLFTFTVDGNHRLRKMQPGTRLLSAFLRPTPPQSPFFPLCWNAAGGHARGFQTSVCVGGPWRVTHHNSRVEWAGQRRGEKINSVRRGFPN